MSNDSFDLTSISRRRFLKVAGGTAAGLALQPLAGAVSPARAAHHTVAERAINGAKKVAGSGDSLTIMMTSGAKNNVDPILSAWQKATGIPVETIPIGTPQVFEKATTEAVSRTGQYDLIFTMNRWLGSFASMGLARELDGWIDRYDPQIHEGEDSYIPPVDDYTTRFLDAHYGLGADMDVWSMMYRRDLFEDPDERRAFKSKYGYELQPPRTWSQLSDVAEFFDRPDQGLRGAFLYRNQAAGYAQWMQRFISRGGIFFDPETMDPMINSKEGIRALKEMNQLRDHMSRETITGSWDVLYSRFTQGQAAVTMAWPSLQKWSLDPERSTINDRVGFAPVPGTEHDSGLVRAAQNVFGWGLTISNYSANPELAYLWGQWYISPSVSSRAIPRTGILDPYRKTHYRDDNIIKSYSKKGMDVLQQSLQLSYPEIKLNGSESYIRSLTNNLQKSWRGELSAKEALDQTAQEWKKTTVDLGVLPQKRAWNLEIKQYARPIRDLWKEQGKI